MSRILHRTARTENEGFLRLNGPETMAILSKSSQMDLSWDAQTSNQVSGWTARAWVVKRKREEQEVEGN